MNTKSRTQHPSYTAQRLNVNDHEVSWSHHFTEYFHSRPYYQHEAVTKNLEGPEEKRWAEEHSTNPEDNKHLLDRITVINGYPQTLKEANTYFDLYNQ